MSKSFAQGYLLGLFIGIVLMVTFYTVPTNSRIDSVKEQKTACEIELKYLKRKEGE